MDEGKLTRNAFAQVSNQIFRTPRLLSLTFTVIARSFNPNSIHGHLPLFESVSGILRRKWHSIGQESSIWSPRPGLRLAGNHIEHAGYVIESLMDCLPQIANLCRNTEAVRRPLDSWGYGQGLNSMADAEIASELEYD